MKIGKKVIAHLGLCGFLLACGRGALALECHLDSENGITEESENIGALTVAADLPLGSRLWTSKIMTRSVVCWAQDSTKGEWVYFYGNPVGDVVRPGIGRGLIYNDADLGIVKASSKVQTDMWRLKDKPEKGQVKYQIYLEKIGEIKEGDNDRVAVFQLDGGTAASNKAFSIFAWRKVYLLTAWGLPDICITSCCCGGGRAGLLLCCMLLLVWAGLKLVARTYWRDKRVFACGKATSGEALGLCIALLPIVLHCQT